MPAINYYVPDSKYDQLVILSKKKGMTKKQMLDKALDEWLAKQEPTK